MAGAECSWLLVQGRRWIGFARRCVGMKLKINRLPGAISGYPELCDLKSGRYMLLHLSL